MTIVMVRISQHNHTWKVLHQGSYMIHLFTIYDLSLYQGSVGSFAGSVLPFLFVWTVSRWNCCNWLFSRSALWSIFAWTVSMISIIINRHNHDHNCQHLMIIKLSRWKLFQNRSPLFQSHFEKSGGQTPKSKQKHCYKNNFFSGCDPHLSKLPRSCWEI